MSLKCPACGDHVDSCYCKDEMLDLQIAKMYRPTVKLVIHNCCANCGFLNNSNKCIKLKIVPKIIHYTVCDMYWQRRFWSTNIQERELYEIHDY